MRNFTLALTVLVGLGLGSAQAQPVPAPAAAGAAAVAGGIQYKQKTNYDFDDDTVEGDLVRPDGEFVDSRKTAKHSSLIAIRTNFIPEMLKSVESL